MTLRERWLAILNRQMPDCIPLDYWATEEATSRLMKYPGCRTPRQMLKKLKVVFIVGAEPPSMP